MTKGISCHGARLKHLPISIGFLRLIKDKINALIRSPATQQTDAKYISRPIYELTARSTVQTERKIIPIISPGLFSIVRTVPSITIGSFSFLRNIIKSAIKATVPPTTVGRIIVFMYSIKSIPYVEHK